MDWLTLNNGQVRVACGDCLEVLQTMEADSVNCCVTSPPYWGLRDYGHDGQIGLERTPEQYTAKLVEVFREVRRVLRDDGTLWLNLGDSYATSGGAVGRSARSWRALTRPGRAWSKPRGVTNGEQTWNSFLQPLTH